MICADDSFLNDLSDDIQKLLNFSLLKGIKITLSGRELAGKRIDLLISEYSKPYYADGSIDDVNYRIIAGWEVLEPNSVSMCVMLIMSSS